MTSSTAYVASPIGHLPKATLARAVHRFKHTLCLTLEYLEQGSITQESSLALDTRQGQGGGEVAFRAHWEGSLNDLMSGYVSGGPVPPH